MAGTDTEKTALGQNQEATDPKEPAMPPVKESKGAAVESGGESVADEQDQEQVEQAGDMPSGMGSEESDVGNSPLLEAVAEPEPEPEQGDAENEETEEKTAPNQDDADQKQETTLAKILEEVITTEKSFLAPIREILAYAEGLETLVGDKQFNKQSKQRQKDSELVTNWKQQLQIIVDCHDAFLANLLGDADQEGQEAESVEAKLDRLVRAFSKHGKLLSAAFRIYSAFYTTNITALNTLDQELRNRGFNIAKQQLLKKWKTQNSDQKISTAGDNSAQFNAALGALKATTVMTSQQPTLQRTSRTRSLQSVGGSSQLLAQFECVQKLESGKLGLAATAILPIQRIPRYALLLREIAKNTPEGEQAKVQNVLVSIQEAATQANQLLDKNDHSQKEQQAIQTTPGLAIRIEGFNVENFSDLNLSLEKQNQEYRDCWRVIKDKKTPFTFSYKGPFILLERKPRRNLRHALSDFQQMKAFAQKLAKQLTPAHDQVIQGVPVDQKIEPVQDIPVLELDPHAARTRFQGIYEKFSHQLQDIKGMHTHSPEYKPEDREPFDTRWNAYMQDYNQNLGKALTDTKALERQAKNNLLANITQQQKENNSLTDLVAQSKALVTNIQTQEKKLQAQNAPHQALQGLRQIQEALANFGADDPSSELQSGDIIYQQIQAGNQYVFELQQYLETRADNPEINTQLASDLIAQYETARGQALTRWHQEDPQGMKAKIESMLNDLPEKFKMPGRDAVQPLKYWQHVLTKFQSYTAEQGILFDTVEQAVNASTVNSPEVSEEEQSEEEEGLVVVEDAPGQRQRKETETKRAHLSETHQALTRFVGLQVIYQSPQETTRARSGAILTKPNPSAIDLWKLPGMASDKKTASSDDSGPLTQAEKANLVLFGKQDGAFESEQELQEKHNAAIAAKHPKPRTQTTTTPEHSVPPTKTKPPRTLGLPVIGLLICITVIIPSTAYLMVYFGVSIPLLPALPIFASFVLPVIGVAVPAIAIPITAGVLLAGAVIGLVVFSVKIHGIRQERAESKLAGNKEEPLPRLTQAGKGADSRRPSTDLTHHAASTKNNYPPRQAPGETQEKPPADRLNRPPTDPANM